MSIQLDGGVEEEEEAVTVSAQGAFARMRELVSKFTSANLCFKWSTTVDEMTG